MLKLAQVCFIGLIVSAAVSCSREPVKEKPVDVVVAEPNKKDPVVEPKKEKVTEAELDKEPSAPIVEALAVEDDTVNYEKALRDDNEAVRLDPKNVKAYNARAWVWATCPDSTYRDGKKAVESASRAVELAPNANNMDTLAAAHAENGDFAEAVRWQEKVLADPNVKEYFGYRQRLELYRDKKSHPQGENRGARWRPCRLGLDRRQAGREQKAERNAGGSRPTLRICPARQGHHPKTARLAPDHAGSAAERDPR